jgi:hypothetical protein
MTGNQNTREVREAIGHGLSRCFTVERDLPDHLRILLRQLELADERAAKERTRDDR